MELKCVEKSFEKIFKYNTDLYKFFSQNIFAPFNWKLFKLGSVSVRDIRKDVPILQVGGSTPFPPTISAIRVVLLHTEEIVQGLLGFTVPTN